MFRLTTLQLERLEASMSASAARRVLNAAAFRWGLPLPDVEAQFSESVRYARTLGFTTDADLAAYLDLARKHGHDFPEQPWAELFFTKRPVDHPSSTLMYLNALDSQRG